MIVNNGTYLYCSLGDTFECTWTVDGFNFETGDTILLSIKETTGSSKIIMSVKCTYSTQDISAYIAAEDFEKIKEGDYVYDIVVLRGNMRKTLLFPANFVVKAVVHDEKIKSNSKNT